MVLRPTDREIWLLVQDCSGAKPSWDSHVNARFNWFIFLGEYFGTFSQIIFKSFCRCLDTTWTTCLRFLKKVYKSMSMELLYEIKCLDKDGALYSTIHSTVTLRFYLICLLSIWFSSSLLFAFLPFFFCFVLLKV